MKIRHLLGILTVIAPAVSSCTVSYEKAVASLSESAACCSSMSEFGYEPLPEGRSVQFALDESSPSFLFPSGKSYFKAFRLPQRGIRYSIHIASFALGESIHKAHIFYPQVMLLDEHFDVLKTSDPRAFRLTKAGYLEAPSAPSAISMKLEASLTVDTPRARYLVVCTTDELLRSRRRYPAVTPIVAPGVIALPMPTAVDMPHSPFGWLRINVAD